MKTRFCFYFVALLSLANPLLSQPAVEDFKTVFQFHMSATTETMRIDGILDEDVWSETNIGTDFWQKVPYFEKGADPKTEVRLTYDEDNLYVSAKCYQKQKVIIQSLKRDQYWDNDGIAIILDPLNTRTNAFIFGVTAAGVQWDALRSQDDNNSDWSNKWYSDVHIAPEFWSMEMAIPLKILRYSGNIKEWGMNFVRNHLNESEYHNWTAVPESFWPPDPAFAGNLIWETAPKPKKGNYNLIPFITTSVSKEPEINTELDVDAGLDARVSVSPTMNLDLTFNPDFSQVDVDRLVTNLTRFSIFLPERRTFFLENSDLFADFGGNGARPFFSRRIGLDTERQAVPILYGMRLTGNLTTNTRLGVMNVHSLKSENTAAQNQSALSIQRRFGRSYIQGLFLNRQGFDDFSTIQKDYGRNASLKAGYVTNNGRYNLWFGANKSFKEGVEDKSTFYDFGFEYRDPQWQGAFRNTIMNKNFYADLGFVQRIENYDAVRDTTIRVGYRQNETNLSYRVRPIGGEIARHQFRIENEVFFNEDWTFNERRTEFNYNMVFRTRAEIRASLNNREVDLLFPFTFVSDAEPLPAQRYNFTSYELAYESDDRKLFSYELEARLGDFYNGSLTTLNAELQFRVQPWGNLGFEYEWNKLDFPDEYGNETITALQTRMEIGFNRNLLWTTLVQYVDQSEFLGINSRLQWRFSPMSDIFLVFVDNYDVFKGMSGPRQINSKNRALIFKVNYWY